MKVTIASVTIIAIFAVAALGTASASAAECPGTGEGVVLCSGGHVLEGTIPFTGKATPSEHRFEVAGVLTVGCEKFTSKGQFLATNASVNISQEYIEWSGCKLLGHSACKVKPLTFGVGSGLHGVVGLVGTLAETTVAAAESRLPVAQLSITGCEQEYEGRVTGTQKCELPNATSEATKHGLSCLAQGSELKVNGRAATLTDGEEIALSGGQAFSLQRA